MSGTGLVKYKYDPDKEIFGINLSGESGDGNYRNDASILFYASNSYKTSYALLEKELDLRFKNKAKEREVSHYVLPLLFNFRHYVELEIKALYAAVSAESPRVTHNLCKLFDDFKEIIDNDYKGCGNEERKKILNSIISKIIQPLDALIKEYAENEPAVEYYRYIFEVEKDNEGSHLVLDNPIIDIDFVDIKVRFNSIIELFNKLRIELNRLDYYVWYFI